MSNPSPDPETQPPATVQGISAEAELFGRSLGSSGGLDVLKCKQVIEVCSAEMERPLRLGEQLSLRTHLMMCTACSEYRRQVRAWRDVMRAYADGRAPTEPASSRR